jgi:WD40 repeat protein
VQRTRLRNLLYVSKVALAHQAIKEKDLQQASRLLAEARTEAPDVARNFVSRYLWNQVAAPGEVIATGDADIYKLIFSPSGRWLAAGGADSVLRIYRSDTLTPLISFSTEQKEINGATFSPDEQLVATTGDDGTLRLWEVQTGESQLTIQADGQLAFDAVFTPDGATLITCGHESSIRIWDAATGAQRGTLEGHLEGVEAITLSPDGKHLASAGSDGSVRLWDVASRDLVRVLSGHTGRVVDVVYSSDGEYLLSGSIDHSIRLWRVADGACLQIEHHVDAIASANFYAGDTQLVAADRGGVVHLWPRRPGDPAADPSSMPAHSWKAHEGRVWEVSPMPDESGLLTAGADGKVYRWTQLPEPHRSLEVPAGREIFDVDFDPAAARLYYIDSELGVRSWDIDSGRQSILREPSKANDRQPFELCMLPEQRLITAYSDGTLDTIDLLSKTDTLRLRFPRVATPDWLVTRLAASRFGRLALFSYARETTQVYDVAQARLVGSFEAYAQAMALSTNGTRLAMSDGDDVVLWNVDRGERIARLKGHTSSVVSLHFSPDDKWLASGSKDRYVRMWSLEEPREPIIFDGHRDEVAAVAFSPDGQLLASGDLRGELKFWFLAEAAELISIEASPAIQQLLFSPSGDWLAVQSAGELRVYHAGGFSSMNP